MRLYKLQPDPYFGVYTGLTYDQRQALVTADHYRNLLVVVLFDWEGNIVEVQEKCYLPEYSAAVLSLAEKVDLLKAVREDWLVELGFQEQPIGVRKFFLRDHQLGIEDEPEWDFDSEADRLANLDMIQEWRESGDFVFWCNTDLWCNADGCITDS
jgi:hypothetical protein